MFPSIAAASSLMAIGLISLVPPRRQRILSLGVAVPFFVIALVAPWRYIAPTYAVPATVSELPSNVVPIDAHFGDLRLLGATIPSVTVEEGGHVPVTLYWQAQKPITENFSLYLHALGRDYQEIGKIDSYPGAGSLPTSQMQPGVIYRDTYSLELNPDFDAPTAIRVLVGVALHHPDGSYDSLEPTRNDGTSIPDVVLQSGVAYPQDLAACDASHSGSTPIASFGGFALMWPQPLPAVVSPGDDVPIEMIWDRMGATPKDWTVFVHLFDANGNKIAQADAPPLNGFYPTSLWQRSCPVLDTHMLHLPENLASGEYKVVVGLYDSADPAFTRAVAADAAGNPYPNFAVPLGSIKVVAP
jgi:hypothetical protein